MEPTDNVPATSESQPEDKTDLVSFVSSATANIHEALGKRSENKPADLLTDFRTRVHRLQGKRCEQGSGGEGTTSESSTKSISTELSPSPPGPSAKKRIPAGGIDRRDSWQKARHDTPEERAPEIELPSPSQSTYPINRSPHFTIAEKSAGIPFLHHTVLECDYHSQEYTIQDHDITLRIPEGAVPTGKKIQFEIAVAMYGPFKFEKDTQPISPIIWLCFDEGVTLNKPFHVILPHFLTGLTYERAQYHHVIFAKALHSKHSIEDGQMKYSFQSCDSEPYFASCEGRNFGVLVTNHTCFYCLQANKTPELTMDAGYCLARIEHFNQRHMEVTFTAVYCLRTCLRVRKQH